MVDLNYYVALVHKEPKSCWGVLFPDFSGCISAGDTYAEAMAMAAEALAFHVAGVREDGDAIPAPRSLEAIKASGEHADELKDAIVAMIPLLPAASAPMAISVSMDRALLGAIDRHAELTGRSRSALLAEGAQLILLSRAPRPTRKTGPLKKAGKSTKARKPALKTGRRRDRAA